MVDRVIATPEALALIERLKARHGPGLMFHQELAQIGEPGN